MDLLSRQTVALLESIERRINPDVEDDLSRQWKDFLYDRFDGVIFTPKRTSLSPAGSIFPEININDAVDNYELMLMSQLQGVSAALNTPGRNLCILANYGTGILTSVFGAQIFKMPREMNTLPTTRSLGSTEQIRQIMARGIPNINTGLGCKVLEFGEFCAEVFRKYPKISRYVEVYHPDTQGPLDIAELLWGGEMFYCMYDEPELVHALLHLITDTYTRFLTKWFERFPKNSEMNSHWDSLRHRGSIVLRDDSAMNLSPEFYREFAAPYDGELLKRFDGGIIHFCGRGDHYIEVLNRLPKLYGINMSQPELNDMETIYRNTVDQGLKILAFSEKQAKKDQSRPGQFHHNISVI